MEFKDYLEFSELQEDIDFVNEGLGSTLMGVVDAGISGTGTAGKQILRGAGNTVRGVGGLAAHGLGTVFGDEKSREDAKKKLGSSFNRTFRGLGQIATSPYASLRRGWEAGRDPFSEMKPDDGSGWGEMMGLRQKPSENPSFEDLLNAYSKAKNEYEKNEILDKMKKLYRDEYEKLRRETRAKRIRKSKKILGFKEGEVVTRTTVEQKYKELAKIHHPDRGGNPENFKLIKDARDHLLNEISKREEARKRAV